MIWADGDYILVVLADESEADEAEADLSDEDTGESCNISGDGPPSCRGQDEQGVNDVVLVGTLELAFTEATRTKFLTLNPPLVRCTPRQLLSIMCHVTHSICRGLHLCTAGHQCARLKVLR